MRRINYISIKKHQKTYFRIIYECRICNKEFVRTYIVKERIKHSIYCRNCKGICYQKEKLEITRDLNDNSLICLKEKKITDF
jgi:transcription elongation factor Elf1